MLDPRICCTTDGTAVHLAAVLTPLPQQLVMTPGSGFRPSGQEFRSHTPGYTRLVVESAVPEPRGLPDAVRLRPRRAVHKPLQIPVAIGHNGSALTLRRFLTDPAWG
ncbi:hypothetical protein GCM10023176_26640 [Micromonospora coerulea]|uniref:Glycosyltransferase family 9 protein n=1 Tax=Micromonospora coerulea TaxID=47856 RepID=A0ABP8SJA4_9ACTN